MMKKTTMAWIAKFIGPYRLTYCFSVFLAFVAVISAFMPYFFIGSVIRQLLEGSRNCPAYTNDLLWVAFFWLLHLLANSLSTSLSHQATFSVLAEMRTALTEKLARLPLGDILSQPSGSYKNIIVERVDATETTLAHIIPEFTAAVFGPLIIFAYMLALDWRVTLLSLLTLPIGFLFYANMLRKSKGDFENTLVKTKTLNDVAVEYIKGIEIIKVFGKEKFSYDRFVKAAQEGADCFIEWMRKCNLDMAAVTVIMPSLLFFLLPSGTYFTLTGSLAVNRFLLLIILSMGLVPPIISAASYMDDIRKIGATFAEIIDILEMPNLERPEHFSHHFLGTDLELSHVCFAYQKGEGVLHDITLSIKSGTVNALVGPSGSGKSTIAKLIASFWDVGEGEITYGGVNIKDIPLALYARQIAYVSQDNYLFDTSILENIRMGNPDASDEMVIEAAKQCGCYDFIMQLGDGFQTIVGSSGGIGLSGGERQRIAIARAMLKDAPIIILDEATAYTDPENEALIQSSLAKLIQGRTLLVIAHRLSTIADCDQIIVLKDGAVQAKGKHDELLADCSLYRKMWQSHLAVKDSSLSTAEGGAGYA
ncbi:ABC transporter ATP-binding protein [Streptococcus sp. H31]|uniref:ABC transporter ATP-binding protein n=1 Tax=Streptococcus huangxiaojuni TaxID=3237239 RepID=UPI0034A2E061